jgi:hypothetical protein
MGVRASDAERDRTVASLRRAYAAGRLKLDELERRIERAYDSEWRHELRALTRDLPFELTVDRRKVASGVDRFQRGLVRFHAWCYASFNTVFVSMWAWGGGGEFFWPAFSLVPGGALLLWHHKGAKAASRRLRRASGDRPMVERRERRRRHAIAA